MPSSFDSEKNAIANCDRCSFLYPLKVLKKERNNLTLQNLRVCPECWDKDHPQNSLGRKDFSESVGLRDPRPDQGLSDSRYGDSVRFEFEIGLEGWVGQNSTASHDVDSNRMDHVWTSEIDPYVHNLSTSFDAATYPVLRVRVWIDDFRDTLLFWVGEFWWKRTGDSPDFDISRRKIIEAPVISMGSQYVDLLWDMSSDATWASTIESLRLDLFGASTSSGTVHFEHIRFEREY